MQKTILTLLFLPVLGFAQENSKAFSIEGKVKNLHCSTASFFLQYRVNGAWFTDSLSSADGKYHFSGTIGASSLAKMWMKCRSAANEMPVPFIPEKDKVAFFLKPGKTKAVSEDSFCNMTLTGAITRLANNGRGKSLQEKQVGEKAALGRMAPDFSLPDTSGNQISLSSFRGQYVLLEFWASWCAPCKPENKQLVLLNRRFKTKPFHIVAVSLDGDEYEKQWRKTIVQDGLAWTHLSNRQSGQNEVTSDYGITFLPQHLLLDPEGRIIAKNLPVEELEKKLAELLR